MIVVHVPGPDDVVDPEYDACSGGPYDDDIRMLLGLEDPTFILPEYAHRFWIVDDFPSGRLVVAVAAERNESDDRLARADEVLSTMNLI